MTSIGENSQSRQRAETGPSFRPTLRMDSPPPSVSEQQSIVDRLADLANREMTTTNQTPPPNSDDPIQFAFSGGGEGGSGDQDEPEPPEGDEVFLKVNINGDNDNGSNVT